MCLYQKNLKLNSGTTRNTQIRKWQNRSEGTQTVEDFGCIADEVRIIVKNQT